MVRYKTKNNILKVKNYLSIVFYIQHLPFQTHFTNNQYDVKQTLKSNKMYWFFGQNYQILHFSHITDESSKSHNFFFYQDASEFEHEYHTQVVIFESNPFFLICMFPTICTHFLKKMCFLFKKVNLRGKLTKQNYIFYKYKFEFLNDFSCLHGMCQRV
jgi:hypothetical protein